MIMNFERRLNLYDCLVILIKVENGVVKPLDVILSTIYFQNLNWNNWKGIEAHDGI